MATRPSAQALASAARAVSDDKPRRNRRTKPEAANAPPPPPTEKRAAPRPKPKRRPNRARRDDGASAAAAEAVVAPDPRAVVAAEAPRSAEVSPGILDAWLATQLRRGVKPSIPDAMGYLRSVGVNLRQLDDDRRQAWLDAIEATVDRAAADDVRGREAKRSAGCDRRRSAGGDRHGCAGGDRHGSAGGDRHGSAGGDRREAPAAQAIVVEERWKPCRRGAARSAREGLVRGPGAAGPGGRARGAGRAPSGRRRVGGDRREAPDEPTRRRRPAATRCRTRTPPSPPWAPPSPARGRPSARTRRSRARAASPLSLLRWLGEGLDEASRAYVAKIVVDEALSEDDAGDALASAEEAARPFLLEDEDRGFAARPRRGGGRGVRRGPRGDGRRVPRGAPRRQRGREALYAEAERVLRDMEQQESLDRRVARQGAFFTHRLSKDERARLLDEFASRPPIPAGGHTTGCHVAPGKKEARKQTRYRDGKVATLTGEKFLVQPKETADFVKQTSVSLRIYAGGRTH
ncbi:hypothetical protein JL722_10761 [Aureococcus anophagefferens]|nr:hypothetical protein JL722_10761 [Aureococcus anophagefferens]